MKTKHIIHAVDDNYYTVNVVFDNSDSPPLKHNPKRYTFKAQKSIELNDGDFVIVMDAMDFPQIVQIVDVHDEPQINWDSNLDYKWIVQKVDFTAYNATLERDRNFTKKIVDYEIKNKRDQVLAAFGISKEELLPLLEIKPGQK